MLNSKNLKLIKMRPVVSVLKFNILVLKLI